jgi:hypothetical protein
MPRLDGSAGVLGGKPCSGVAPKPAHMPVGRLASPAGFGLAGTAAPAHSATAKTITEHRASKQAARQQSMTPHTGRPLCRMPGRASGGLRAPPLPSLVLRGGEQPRGSPESPAPNPCLMPCSASRTLLRAGASCAAYFFFAVVEPSSFVRSTKSPRRLRVSCLTGS